MALKPRTGNQYVISSGEWSAVVTELGASLRELKWRGEDLIVPFDPNKVIPCCNGWVLAPYPNRVTNGQYSFDGEDYQMPIDEFDRQSSLHGYAYRYMWELVDLQESHVTLSWRSPDIAGYPFDITITATYALDENGLTETFTVHNNDSVKAPWAFGIHPWLANGKHATGQAITADNEPCRLELHCDTHVTVDEHLLAHRVKSRFPASSTCAITPRWRDVASTMPGPISPTAVKTAALPPCSPAPTASRSR